MDDSWSRRKTTLNLKKKSGKFQETMLLFFLPRNHVNSDNEQDAYVERQDCHNPKKTWH